MGIAWKINRRKLANIYWLYTQRKEKEFNTGGFQKENKTKLKFNV
jgi:hypothetical protein